MRPIQRLQYIPGRLKSADLIDAKVLSAGFAAHAVGLDLERNLLAFIEGAQTGPFDGADMNEDVLAAVIGLDEAEALCRIKPLNCSGSHLCVQGAPKRDELARPSYKRDPSSATSWGMEPVTAPSTSQSSSSNSI